jgi:hypothetical protein
MKIKFINLSVLLFFGAMIVVPKTAFATPNFPPAIQTQLSLAAPPDCSICHTDGDTGGKGTANTPFAQNMRSRGLVEFDTSSLTTALNEMESEHVDSAGDCLDDIDELKAGRNPNLPDPPGVCGDAGAPVTETPPSGPVPTYGCFGSISPRSAPERSGASIMLLAALVLLRRRARRTKR